MTEKEKTLAFRIGTHFLAVQWSDDGYDYSVYDDAYKPVDGGRYTGPESDIRTASAKILAGEPWLAGAKAMDEKQLEAYAALLITKAAPIEHETLMRYADAAFYAQYAGISPAAYLAAGDTAPAGRRFYIYQLKAGATNHLLRFTGLDTLRREKGNGFEPQLKNYEKVYSGTLKNGETLEELYSRFNLSLPKDFHGHSMSVSDVVAVEWEGNITANYVDSVGFESFPQMANEIRAALAIRKEQLPFIGEVTYSNGDRRVFLDEEEYLATIREELPRWGETGFHFKTLKNSVEKAVAELLQKNVEILEFRCKDMVYQAQVKIGDKSVWAGVQEQAGQLYVVTDHRISGDWMRHDFNASQTAQFEVFLNRQLAQEACILR